MLRWVSLGLLSSICQHAVGRAGSAAVHQEKAWTVFGGGGRVVRLPGYLGTGCAPGEHARELLQGWVSLLLTTLANFQPVSARFSARYGIFQGRLWKAAVHLVGVNSKF